MHEQGAQVVLRRAGAAVIALARSQQYTGYLSKRGLPKGLASAVMCHEVISNEVAEYLSSVAQRRCDSIRSRDLPPGWNLFLSVTPVRHDAVPEGLEALTVDTTVDVIPSGGFRIGRRWTWLDCGPPQLRVSGLQPGSSARIDGEQVEVGIDGLIKSNGRLSTKGAHVIEADGVQKTIEIVTPEMSQPSRPSDPSAATSATGRLLALPVGLWTIVGANPSETLQIRAEYRSGILATCSFNPVWAIQVGSGPGASVIYLEDAVAPSLSTPGRKERHAHSEPWTSVIYNAHLRRPQLSSVKSGLDASLIVELWRQYVHRVRRLKRMRRSARR